MNISEIDSLFYTDQLDNDRACLPEEEMRHAIKVLRKRVGDELTFTDGKGTFYTGRIDEIGKRETWLQIMGSVTQRPDVIELKIAVAPTKNFDRMEWCIEKLTEIGVHTIIPIICERSEREKWKTDRARKIAISAMKQSKRAYLPFCAEPMKLSEVFKGLDGDTCRYIALQNDKSVHAVKHYKPGLDVLILVGPEGDFTPKEIKTATEHGYIPLSLGEYRLRTETAAVMAAATFQALNQ